MVTREDLESFLIRMDADYEELEDTDKYDDRQDVGARAEQSRERALDHIHAMMLPYAMTKIIGVSDANAIRPKPSVIGLRSLSDDAIPTPSAATSGTVTVDVVTPPES